MTRNRVTVFPWAKRLGPDEFQIGFTIHDNEKHDIYLPPLSLGNTRMLLQGCDQAVTAAFRHKGEA